MNTEPPKPAPNVSTPPLKKSASGPAVNYQVCQCCAKVQPYRRSHCMQCQSTDTEIRGSTGHGKLVSYTIVHRAPTQAFKDKVPYGIALVWMDEGFQIMASADTDHLRSLAIGAAVCVVVSDSGDGVQLNRLSP